MREQREWLCVARSSIGDAVITTGTAGAVTLLNPVASIPDGQVDARQGLVEDAARLSVAEGVVTYRK